MTGRRLTATLVVAALASAPALGDSDPSATAARAAEMLEQAGFALMEADGARDRIEALTQTVRAYEEGLLSLREGVRQAALRERTILVVFDAERDRLARLLGVLQSIETTPDPMVLLHPSGAMETARSGMIVSDVAPAVAREALALRGQLEELAMLRDLQSEAIERLSTALNEVQDARSALSQAIADRVELPPRFVEDREAMQRLIDSVDSLDGFAEVLARDTLTAGTDTPDFQEARGTLDLPLLGAVIRGFGEPDAAGVARPGLVIASPPRALVTSPWAATVRYAGPLLDYGNVIILEPQEDYLMVLAGLGDIFVLAGELIHEASPIGLMPGVAPASEELIATEAQDAGAGLTETLYIELREAGQTVDPTDWFTGMAREN